MRCTLIYNPASGRRAPQRAGQLQRVVQALEGQGHQAALIATTAPGSAGAQVRAAVQAGAQVVFACGGDGTIHEVIQGLVSEGGQPSAALGILPMGSANALARHLKIPADPLAAAMRQIAFAPQSIPVGKLQISGQICYFTVMAGAGADGALAYDLLAGDKSQLGRLAYSARAARLCATRRFRPFQVDFALDASGAAGSQRAVSAMAVRVGSLGGLFHGLAGRGASLRDPHLTLLLLKPPAWFSLPLWFLSGWLNLQALNPLLLSVRVSRFACLPLPGPAPRVQADGEPLGRIPMQVSIVPNALRLLLPEEDPQTRR